MPDGTSQDDAAASVALLRAELAGCEKETEALAAWATDQCLLRFLRARSFSVPKALKMLQDTISWRKSYMPEAITWGQVAEEAETGKMYRLVSRDKQGRPVVVMRPRNQNTKDHDGQIRLLVYTMENAIASVPRDSQVEKMTWLIDFNGYTLSKAPPMKTSLETLHVLQSYYPERLGQAVLYCPPKIFGVFWKMIYPFIDPVTAEKIVFVNPSDKAGASVMSEQFDMSSLEGDLGGSGPPGFVLEEYARLCQQDDAMRAGRPANDVGRRRGPPTLDPMSSGKKWGWKGDRVDPDRPLSPAILGVI